MEVKLEIALRSLKKQKKEIEETKRLKMSFSDYCKEYHPDYYNMVTDIIEFLALKCEVNGHSKELDFQKNTFYYLLNL